MTGTHLYNLYLTRRKVKCNEDGGLFDVKLEGLCVRGCERVRDSCVRGLWPQWAYRAVMQHSSSPRRPEWMQPSVKTSRPGSRPVCLSGVRGGTFAYLHPQRFQTCSSSPPPSRPEAHTHISGPETLRGSVVSL